MVQHYVWWDDIKTLKRRRVELRLPEPLYDFFADVAKTHDVTFNALVAGCLHYIAMNRPGLVITVEPSVRVTENTTGPKPVELTVPPASWATRKRWEKR